MAELTVPEIQERGPFTIRAVAFAVLSSLAWIAAQSFVGPMSGFYVTGEGAFAMVFLAAVLFRGHLRPAEYALIFGMVEVTSIAAIDIGAMSAAPLAINLFSGLSPLLQVVPHFFKLPTSALEAALYGGALMPLDLAPIMLTMSFIYAVFFLLLLITVVLLRRAMIEVEQIPFPVARACYAVTGFFGPPNGIDQKLKRRAFLQGAIAGVLLVAVTEGYFVSQELPFIRLIPYSLSEPIYQALKPFLPGALMGFSWAGAVWTMWFLYLAPAESTITAALANFLAYMVLAPIQVAFRAIRWDPSIGYSEFFAELYDGQAISYSWLSTGLFLAGAVIPLGISLRALLSDRGSIEAPRRLYLLASSASLFLLTLLGAYLMGMPPLLSAILVVAILLGYNLWLTRSLAELNTTQSNPGLFMGSMWLLGTTLSGFRLGEASVAAYGTIATSYLLSSNATLGAGCMEAFRLASLTRMKWIDMFLTLACGALLASLFGPLLYLTTLYASGLPTSANDPRGILWSQAAASLGSDAAIGYLIRGQNPYGVNWSSGFAGFLLGLAAIILRMRFPSFPISVIAAGVGVATEPGSCFLVFLLPGLARVLTLKVGGIRLYEEFGVPLFTGLSCGAVLGALLSSLNLLRRTLGFP
jgi:hypothetical protein